MNMTKIRQKLDSFECGNWQKCLFCHDIGIPEAKIFDLYLAHFCKIIKILEGFKFQKFQNLQKYCVTIEFLFLKNNHSDSNFNQKFDYEFSMQGLNGNGFSEWRYIVAARTKPSEETSSWPSTTKLQASVFRRDVPDRGSTQTFTPTSARIRQIACNRELSVCFKKFLWFCLNNLI